jgi:hypothetical protein
MTASFSNSDAILATLSDLLEAGGMARAASILKSAEARFETTGYDNWNGGTNIYTLFLHIDPAERNMLGLRPSGSKSSSR